MSSAILYFAIIAIWAVFLVPAWLRRPNAHSDRTTAGQEAQATEAYEHADNEITVQYVEDLTETEDDVQVEADIHVEVSHHTHNRVYFEEEPSVYSETSEYTEDYGPEYPESEVPAEAEVGSGPPAPRPSQSREQMLRARRRMLTILVAMTAVTGLFTYVGVVAWWIVVPPAVLLALYVLLLREIAMADAELARKRAQWEAAEAERAGRGISRPRRNARPTRRAWQTPAPRSSTSPAASPTSSTTSTPTPPSAPSATSAARGTPQVWYAGSRSWGCSAVR